MHMLKLARIYLSVSADAQDLKRQFAVVEFARANGYYIGGVYAEKASSTCPDRRKQSDLFLASLRRLLPSLAA